MQISAKRLGIMQNPLAERFKTLKKNPGLKFSKKSVNYWSRNRSVDFAKNDPIPSFLMYKTIPNILWGVSVRSPFQLGDTI